MGGGGVFSFLFIPAPVRSSRVSCVWEERSSSKTSKYQTRKGPGGSCMRVAVQKHVLAFIGLITSPAPNPPGSSMRTSVADLLMTGSTFPFLHMGAGVSLNPIIVYCGSQEELDLWFGLLKENIEANGGTAIAPRNYTRVKVRGHLRHQALDIELTLSSCRHIYTTLSQDL